MRSEELEKAIGDSRDANGSSQLSTTRGDRPPVVGGYRQREVRAGERNGFADAAGEVRAYRVAAVATKTRWVQKSPWLQKA